MDAQNNQTYAHLPTKLQWTFNVWSLYDVTSTILEQEILLEIKILAPQASLALHV